ncbi:MAG: hypothetical protein H0T39_08730 [Actinobacteria bacterium]|nr:hypothetical protein [Actinomycetota bacterium]
MVSAPDGAGKAPGIVVVVPGQAADPPSLALPGEELVSVGIADLERGVESIEALLVSIGARRLSDLGLLVSAPLAAPELRLYELLAREDADAAHSRYNALVRRLVSYERAAECAS